MKLTITQEAPLSGEQVAILTRIRSTDGKFRMKSARYDGYWMWEIIVTEISVTLSGGIDIYGFSRGYATMGDWKRMNGVRITNYVAEGVNE